MFPKIADVDVGSIAEMSGGRVVAVAKDRVLAIDLTNGEIEVFPVPTAEPVCVASSGEYVAVAGGDAILYVFREGEDMAKPWVSMPTYGGAISCVCVSAAFFVAVIGTRDGSLMINSLNKGATVRVLDLKGRRPSMVCVTPAWGFIVAYVTKLKNAKLWHRLLVFNINGRWLRKVKLDFQITNWTCWASVKGFDYMVVSDERGKLFGFEVFYAEVGDSFYRCHAPVSSLLYIVELGAVVVMTHDGQVLFIPHVPDRSEQN
jgi:hypothetical protein